MKGALPYYRWHWRDYRSNRKVQRMDYVSRGLYRELLDECWAEGFIPNDTDKLAVICGCPKQVLEDCWQLLADCFTEIEPGILVNERMNEERTEKDDLRVTRSIIGASGGKAKAIARQSVAIASKVLPNPSKSHIAVAVAEHKQSSPVVFDPSFDGGEWALKTCKAYPTWANPDAMIVPHDLAVIYDRTIKQEAPSHGGMTKTAEWFLSVVKEYSRQHPDGKFVMTLDKFLRKGYAEVKFATKRTAKSLSQRLEEMGQA